MVVDEVTPPSLLPKFGTTDPFEVDAGVVDEFVSVVVVVLVDDDENNLSSVSKDERVDVLTTKKLKPGKFGEFRSVISLFYPTL